MKKAYSIIVVSTMNNNHSQYIVSSVLITDRDGLHKFDIGFKSYTHTNELLELAYKNAVNNNYYKPEIYNKNDKLYFKNIHILLDNFLLNCPYTKSINELNMLIY